MPITSQVPRNVSTAAPGAAAFPYDFKILDKAHLLVQVTVGSVTTTKTEGVDYTLTGVGSDTGGSVNFVVPMVGGERVMRKRNMPYERGVDFQNLGDLRSATLNNDQDAPVMMAQQLAEEIGRSLRLPASTAGSSQLPDIVPLRPLVGSSDGLSFQFGDTALTGDMLLRGELVSPDAGKGSALVKYKSTLASAIERSLQSKLQDFVSVLDFIPEAQHAAIRDGTTAYDCAAGFQAAVNAVRPTGAIYVPVGTYRIGSAITSANKAFTVYGEDRQSTQLNFFNGTSGFVITHSGFPALDSQYTISFRGLWFITPNQSDASTAKAISVSYPSPAGDGGSTALGMLVENCFFSGAFRFDQWWPYGVYGNNCSVVIVDGCGYQGKANTTKGHAYRMEGKSDSFDVRNSYAICCESGITQDSSSREDFGAEALRVSLCGIDDCDIGIQKLHANVSGVGEPQFQVYDTHINARKHCIKGVNAYEVQIDNCLLYLQGTSLEAIDPNPDAISLADTSAGTTNRGFSVTNTQIRQLDSVTLSRGITTNMRRGLIDGCAFVDFNPGRAIDLGVTSQDVTVTRNNKFSNCTVLVLNGGSNNYTGQPQYLLPAQDFGLDQMLVNSGVYMAFDSSGRLRAKGGSGPFTNVDSQGVPVASFGPELSTDPYMDLGGWSAGTGWSVGSGLLSKTAGTASSTGRSIGVVAGRRYRIEIAIRTYSGGVLAVGFTGGTDAFYTVPASVATHVGYVTAVTGNNTLTVVSDAVFAGGIESISVREVLN